MDKLAIPFIYSNFDGKSQSFSRGRNGIIQNQHKSNLMGGTTIYRLVVSATIISGDRLDCGRG